jgi:hypothetical protein
VSPIRSKLLQLHDAIESLMDQGNEDAWLSPEMMEKLGEIRAVVSEWLGDECVLSEDEQMAILARLTDGLAVEIVTTPTGGPTLH